jgi:hypothetical protein
LEILEDETLAALDALRGLLIREIPRAIEATIFPNFPNFRDLELTSKLKDTV